MQKTCNLVSAINEVFTAKDSCIGSYGGTTEVIIWTQLRNNFHRLRYGSANPRLSKYPLAASAKTTRTPINPNASPLFSLTRPWLCKMVRSSLPCFVSNPVLSTTANACDSTDSGSLLVRRVLLTYGLDADVSCSFAFFSFLLLFVLIVVLLHVVLVSAPLALTCWGLLLSKMCVPAKIMCRPCFLLLRAIFASSGASFSCGVDYPVNMDSLITAVPPTRSASTGHGLLLGTTSKSNGSSSRELITMGLFRRITVMDCSGTYAMLRSIFMFWIRCHTVTHSIATIITPINKE